MRARSLITVSAIVALLVSGDATLASPQGAMRVIVAPNEITQPMPAGTGIVSGQIREARGNTVVPDAVVSLSLGSRTLRVVADAQGRFAFPSLPAGSFTLSAAMPGFSDGAHGRLRPGGSSQPVELTDGERVTDITIPLWPHATIAGTVVDDIGEPVIGARVRTYRRSLVGGRVRLTSGPSDATDDRGWFRIAGLDAGEYIVGLPMTSHTWPAALEHYMQQGGEWPQDLTNSAAGQIEALIAYGVPLGGGAPIVAQVSDRLLPPDVPGDGRLAVYLAQFFSGTSIVSDATPIVLGAGDERAGVTLTLRTDRTWNVSGTVTGADASIDDLVLRLSPAGAAQIETAVAVTDFRGRFTFVGVPSGQYVIHALRLPRGEPGPAATVGIPAVVELALPVAALPSTPLMWAEQPVTVDAADVGSVTVALRSGTKVRGRVEFNGTLPKPAPETLDRMQIALDPADERTASKAASAIRGRVERTGLFATIGAPAGRYVVTVGGLPDGWHLQGVMMGGRDASVDPLDIAAADVAGVTIVLTDRPSAISGRVSTPAGAPDTQATVIVFPVDPAARIDHGAAPRQVRAERTDRHGAFVASGLPAGRYFVGAVPEALASDWQRPAFLEALARTAVQIDLAAGEAKQVPLQTVRVDVR